MIQHNDGLQLVPSSRLGELVAAGCLSDLLHEGLEVAKLFKERLVREVGKILYVVVDLVRALWRLCWYSRVNALQDTQTANSLKEDG